jgi:hypothetical protein
MPVCAEGYRLTTFREEGLEDGGAVCRQDARGDLDLMV